MAVALTVRAVERSGYSSDAPTRSEIVDAMRRVVGQSTTINGVTTTRLGQWAGPAPRITRWESPTGAATYATWVFVVPVDRLADGFAQRLSDDVLASLREHASHHRLLGPAWTVQVSPYNEFENGPAAWWESGAAASEASWVDHWPPLANQVLPGAEMPVEDNHVGPNGAHRPPPVANPLGPITWLVGLGVVGILAIQFGPVIASLVPTKSKPAKAENPRRNRR